MLYLKRGEEWGIFNSQAGGGGARVLVMYYDEETRKLFKDPSWTECSVYINIVYGVLYVYTHNMNTRYNYIQSTIWFHPFEGSGEPVNSLETKQVHQNKNITRPMRVYIMLERVHGPGTIEMHEINYFNCICRHYTRPQLRNWPSVLLFLCHTYTFSLKK